MTALGTVVAPVLVKEPEGLEVAWTQVANADQYTITMYPQTPKTSVDYDLAESTKVVARVAGTGATTELVGSPANKLQPGVLYKATIIAHQISGANTDSTSAATTVPVISPGGKQAAAGAAGERAHDTGIVSAGQTKGQVTYARVGSTITQTTVDATTAVGSTATARDTADLPTGDMQQTAIPDEGDTDTATEGGGKTLLSDLVVTPTSLTANAAVLVNPVTGAMTAITGTEDAAKLADARSVRVDRKLHEIDHLKSTVSKSGVAS